MEADLDEPDHVPLGGDVTGPWDDRWTPAIEGRFQRADRDPGLRWASWEPFNSKTATIV